MVAGELGFDLELSEEQRLVQQTAREFAQNEVLPRAAEIDASARYPEDLVRKMAQLGFFGIYVPSEFGGAGLDFVSYVLVMEEINRACASTGVIVSANNSLVCDPLLESGTKEQKARLLAPLARGDKLGCFALSEPQAGSDASALRTLARRDGDGWRVSGTKNFITNGAQADVVVLFAQTDPEQRHHGITAFLVEKGMGYQIAKEEKKLGIRGSSTVQLVFDDVRVPDANRLGDVGEGFKIAMRTLDGGRIGIAAQAVGIARACLEDSLAYAKQREAFGRPIADFQAIQWMLADMSTEIDAARLLTLRAAYLKDQREPHAAEAAMAKLFASDIAVRASRDCVQIFGGYGYIADFPAERHYRDAKITEIYEGTSEIMKIVIAEDLLAGEA